MDHLTGACGLDCGQCLGNLAACTGSDQELQRLVEQAQHQPELEQASPTEIICDGCLSGGRMSAACRQCEVRRCCHSRGLASCAACERFLCSRLETMLAPNLAVRYRLLELWAFGA